MNYKEKKEVKYDWVEDEGLKKICEWTKCGLIENDCEFYKKAKLGLKKSTAKNLHQLLQK